MPASPARPYGLYIFAHNEQAAIGATLVSICDQAGADETDIHVLVNGSTDGTADVVRAFAGRHDNVFLHDIPAPGKSNAWNLAVHDYGHEYRLYMFMDGDLTLAPGALMALRTALLAHPAANAASGVPYAGRTRDELIASLRAEPGIVGGLYALSGDFVRRLRADGARLPRGMVGDDALLGTMVATDLGPIRDWNYDRILMVEDAGFLFEPLSPLKPSHIYLHYRRMRRYSRRHFENRLIGLYLADRRPRELPADIAGLFAWGEKHLDLRRGGSRRLFDWLARRDIMAMIAAYRAVS
ncbi:MAG: glycosyltransferase [Alphaproteobacteria bacterium]|nr:MAG: glycosyltransferase [Alphaproteobacteria bacterium]